MSPESVKTGWLFKEYDNTWNVKIFILYGYWVVENQNTGRSDNQKLSKWCISEMLGAWHYAFQINV
jgi:hypothetical protein